eukprot:XP_003728553.2 PREDICTED: uncharacterized protein LOC100892491 [Strongylocentrotus purpuratus]
MLIDWRRRVRPSEQVDELHLALQNAGLGHAAEVILQDLVKESERMGLEINYTKTKCLVVSKKSSPKSMKCQPSYKPFISHGIIDDKSAELALDELGIAVSIPEGAIPKVMRSVVTLRVPTHGTPRLPVREGEVVITPTIECSLKQELLKPATVNDVHALNDPHFQPVKGDDDDIVFLQGTLTVACQLGEKSPKSDVHAIQFSDMRMKMKVTKYFTLDLTKESDETLVTLGVVETYRQTIKFNTRFQGIDKETTEQNAPSPSTVEIPSNEQEVTDANILNLAMLLPPYLWYSLQIALCIDYSTAKGIIERSRDITEQYIHLLQTWKAVSTRTRKDLNAILTQVEAGRFVDKYLD